MDVNRYTDLRNKIVKNVSQVIVGKEREIELVLVAFLAGGNVLLEDIPGTGKTMLVKAFAKSLDLSFKRIQFTPDLLPSDITGINFYSQKTGDFEFRPGPLFANVILTDEINRATPRTQSALLEAMEEKQITADGITRCLELPFMVLATQNPVESFGTFPLPEAQLDRFLMRIKLGYPEVFQEKLIIMNNSGKPLDRIGAVVDGSQLDYCLTNVSQVRIQDDVMDYLVNLVDATRRWDSIELGVSPRGSIAFYKACQALAAIKGRDYILPEDVKYMAPHVLNHRIISRGKNSMEQSLKLVGDVVASVKVPIENYRV